MAPADLFARYPSCFGSVLPPYPNPNLEVVGPSEDTMEAPPRVLEESIEDCIEGAHRRFASDMRY